MIYPVANTDIVRISVPTPFEVGNANVFLIKGDSVILVDTGPSTDEAYQRLTAGLTECNVSVSDIEVIVVTHGHLDHAGMLGRLVEESGAEAWAHPHAAARTASYDDDAAANQTFLFKIMRELGAPQEVIAAVYADQAGFRSYGAPCAVDHVLTDGGAVGPLTAYFVPGHSSSDTLLVDPDGNAFVGDHLLTTMNPNPLIRRPAPGQLRPKSLLEFIASLRRTRSLDLELCLPGHGEPFGNHREVIDRLLKKIAERGDRALACLGDSELTPYELSKCMYPKLADKYLYLGLSVAVGHLEVFEAEGKVGADSRDGVLHYRKTSETSQ